MPIPKLKKSKLRESHVIAHFCGILRFSVYVEVLPQDALLEGTCLRRHIQCLPENRHHAQVQVRVTNGLAVCLRS